jgi:hypothetical protein
MQHPLLDVIAQHLSEQLCCEQEDQSSSHSRIVEAGLVASGLFTSRSREEAEQNCSSQHARWSRRMFWGAPWGFLTNVTSR